MACNLFRPSAVFLLLTAGLFPLSSAAQDARKAAAAKTVVTLNDKGRVGVPRQGGVGTLPWEKRLKKFYQRQDGIFRAPRIGLPRVGGKDPLSILGLKRHTPNDLLPKDQQPLDEPVFEPHVAGLDSNGDGGVSRSEYFGNKLRFGGLNTRTQFRQRRHIQRMTSSSVVRTSTGTEELPPTSFTGPARRGFRPPSRQPSDR